MSNQKKEGLWENVHQASRIYLLPNFFTAGNLFFGFLSVVCCIRAKFEVDLSMAPSVQKFSAFIFRFLPENSDISTSYYALAILCILASFLCDALDGRVARASGKSSLFGKEFDSIADSVSFGFAPCMLMYFLVLQPTTVSHESFINLFNSTGWIVGFLFLLCACVRLSRFNVLTNPYIVGHEKYEKGDFCGLPAPAAAGTVATIALTLLSLKIDNYAILLLPLMILISFLMISNIPYPSFKHINWTISTRFRTFVLIITAVILILSFKEYSLAMLFLAYVFYAPIKYSPRMLKILSYRIKKGSRK